MPQRHVFGGAPGIGAKPKGRGRASDQIARTLEQLGLADAGWTGKQGEPAGSALKLGDAIGQKGTLAIAAGQLARVRFDGRARQRVVEIESDVAHAARERV